MKLSLSSKYALRALLLLARQKDPTAVASHQLAGSLGIPRMYFRRLVKRLARAGVVFSSRGSSGGCRLGRPAADISVLDVIDAIEGPVQGAVAVGGKDDLRLDKRLEGICNRVAQATRQILQQTSLADLAGTGAPPGKGK
jgi:Rrf2 family protein